MCLAPPDTRGGDPRHLVTVGHRPVAEDGLGGGAPLRSGGVTVAPPVSSTRAGPLRRAVAGSIAGKTAEMVTLVLLATVVPRVLGPTAYGRFAVPLTVVTLGSLALTLGGPTLMARFVPAAPPAERVALARALGGRLARGRAVQLAALGLVTAVVVAVAPDRLPPLATAYVAAALALNVAASLLLQTALGLGRTGAWSTRYPLQNAVLIVSVLVIYDAAGDIGAVAANLVAAVAAVVFGLAVAVAALRPTGPSVPVPEGAIRFGALQATGAALVQVAQRGGVLAVALLASDAANATETGFAALAIGIALGATYAILQAFTVALPHLADTSADDGEATLRRMAGGLLVVLVPALVVGALLLHRLVPVVFGDDFRGADVAFGPALALVALAPLNALYVQTSALRMRAEASAAAGVAAAGAFLVVAVLAVPAWGGAGGTAAALAGAVGGALASTRLLPGAASPRLLTASAGGAALVLGVAMLAT
jgi:O-antigen/teichoic acid export membrane protein